MKPGGLNKAQDCRRRAEEADRLATISEEQGDLINAETYRDVARKWRDIAEKAERWGV